MAMRLQELHPSLVHFPIALLPVAVGADALGRATGSKGLMEVGRRTMPLAAAGAAIAGVAGLLAQQSSNITEETHPILTTHRNLNLGLIGMSIAMARQRARRKRPGLGYLLAGLGGLAAMTYSAYLGGHMVYEHGVGVKPADGLLDGEAPLLTMDRADEVLQKSSKHIRHGLKHAVKNIASGDLLPTLTQGHGD